MLRRPAGKGQGWLYGYPVEIHDQALVRELLPDIIVYLEVGGLWKAVARCLRAVVPILDFALAVHVLKRDVWNLFLQIFDHFCLCFLHIWNPGL